MKFIVLMSHDISEIQKEDAYKNLKVENIIEAPLEVKSIWKNINPLSELDTNCLDENVITWINEVSEAGDYILVQGEFGATFYIVDYCLKHNLIPVYATSNRRVVETVEDDKVTTRRIFVHEGYRKYKKYQSI